MAMLQANQFELLRAEETTPSPSPRGGRRHKKTKNNSSPSSSPAVENVKIKYQVQFPDFVGSELVARHNPIEESKQLPAVESLASDFTRDVEVSPAKSGCSDTAINVQANMLGLVARVKAELQAEFDQRMEANVAAAIHSFAARTTGLEATTTRLEAGLVTELDTWRTVGFGGTSFDERERSATRKLEFIRLQSQYASMRSIEDWCLDRMRSIMGVSDNVTHAVLVQQFLDNYIPLDCDISYLASLKHSEVRDEASRMIHISSRNDYEVNVMWEALKDCLSNDDAKKYKSLIKFGRGITKVRYRGYL